MLRVSLSFFANLGFAIIYVPPPEIPTIVRLPFSRVNNPQTRGAAKENKNPCKFQKKISRVSRIGLCKNLQSLRAIARGNKLSATENGPAGRGYEWQTFFIVTNGPVFASQWNANRYLSSVEPAEISHFIAGNAAAGHCRGRRYRWQKRMADDKSCIVVSSRCNCAELGSHARIRSFVHGTRKFSKISTRSVCSRRARVSFERSFLSIVSKQVPFLYPGTFRHARLAFLEYT